MAKQSGVTDRLYYHGTDISGDVNALGTIGTIQALLEATGIDSSTPERMHGLASGALSFAAWFNDALSLDLLDALPSTDVVLLYSRGASLGSPCFALTTKQAAFGLQRGADGSLPLSVDAQSTGVAGEWGEMLTAGQVTAADENATPGTGLVTAQTTRGGVGYLQFQERASGTPTFLIEDSSDTTDGDDGTWGTLLTFTATGGASAFGERKTVTGTVEKGLRAGTPTGTYADAVFAIGFKRGVEFDKEDLS